MTWGTVGKILATFAGLWFVMIIMAWLSLAILQSAADEMIGGAMWKEYPLHDWQSGCTIDKLCEPCECEDR